MSLVSEFLFLRNAIEQDLSVNVDRDGNWYIEGCGKRFIRWLKGLEDERVERVVEAFSQRLDDLEQQRGLDCEGRYHMAAVALMSRYSRASNIWKIAYRLKGLEYRLGVNRPKVYFDNSVLDLAVSWKKSKTYLRSFEITEEDMKKLSDLSSYPDFVEILKVYPELQELFFSWTFESLQEVAPFVELPGTVSHFMSCFQLASRLGIQRLLDYKKETQELHMLCYPDKSYNVRQLDLAMDLACGRQVTVREFLEDFKLGWNRPVSFDTTPKGVINYHAAHMGPYNPKTSCYESINLDQPNWWEQLHAIKTVSKEQLLELIPYSWDDKPLDCGQGKWIVSVVATSKHNKEVLLEGNHGYLLVAIPTKEGLYELYPFGKYTKGDWPQTGEEKLRVCFSYLKGCIMYPDENFYCRNRDQVYAATSISATDALKLMDRIREDIKLGWEGKLPFQLFAVNCYEWAIDVIQDHIPISYFKEMSWVNPLETQSKGEAAEFGRWCAALPYWVINVPLNLIAYRFGAGDEMLVGGRPRSFWDHRPWDPSRPKFPHPSTFLVNYLRQRESLA